MEILENLSIVDTSVQKLQLSAGRFLDQQERMAVWKAKGHSSAYYKKSFIFRVVMSAENKYVV